MRICAWKADTPVLFMRSLMYAKVIPFSKVEL